MSSKVFAFLPLLLLPLSGCFGGDGGAQPADTPTDGSVPPGGQVHNTVEGWVLGPDEFPVPNVTVSVASTEYARETDEGGYYQFVNLVPGTYLVVAAKDGYQPAQASVYVQDGFTAPLNFSLESAPTATPYHRTLTEAGEIGCSTFMGEDPETGTYHECNEADPNNRPAVEFTLEPNGMESVVQVYWTPGTGAAAQLTVKVESVDFGAQNAVFANQFVKPGDQVLIGPGSMGQFYGNGGPVRVSLRAGPGITPEDFPIGFGAAVAQQFEVDFTTFYYERAPSDFHSRAP